MSRRLLLLIMLIGAEVALLVVLVRFYVGILIPAA
jgi:hypothetical protein